MSIQDLLDLIMSARYGKDVRSAIHDSIEMISKIAGIQFGTDITSASSPSGTYEIGTVYVNTTTYDVWKLNNVNDWTLEGNIKGASGQNGADGTDAPKINGLVEISHVGLVHTYEFTLDDGSSYTFQVMDGQSGSGTGDMTKAVYDTDNDGIVDKAEAVGNATTSVLEKLSEDSSGNPLYNGQPIGGTVTTDGTTITTNGSGQLTLASDVTTKLSQIPSAITKSNVSVTWASDSTYSDFPYKGTINVSGATSSHIPTVTFSQDDSISGDYANVCESDTNKVYIYSKVNTLASVPSVQLVKGV